MTFLITGATGKTGRGAVELLLAGGHPVRALVHREDERSRGLAAAGAEIAVADLRDLDGTTAAMQGVSGAYLCYPIRDGLIEATTVFAQAATEAGVRSVVNMSQISARRDSGSAAARQHWLSQRLLDRTDLLTTHLRPTFFAEWLTMSWERRGGEGYLRLPFGAGRHAPIAAADQSRVIAALLLDPEPHDRAAYSLHGPVELDHHEIAAVMSATLGLPVHYEPISVEEYASAMTDRGFPAHLVQHLSHVAVDYRHGVFAGTNDNVERIGGRAPQSVEQFVIANKPDFDASGPSFVPSPRVRTVTWADPATTAAMAGTRDGLEFMRALVSGAAPPPPIAQLIGARLVSATKGEAVFTLEPAEYHYNPIGSVHGGIYATLLDSAAGCAVHTMLPAGTAYTSLDLSIRFLRPLRTDTGPVTCTGTVTHLGSRTAPAEARIEDGAGRLLATATSNCLLFPVPAAGRG
jgi:NAD(P)H dehydrogenase (quinone)